MVVRAPDDETLQAVGQLLRELVETRGRNRRRVDAVRPQSAADVVALLNAGVITMAEARRYLWLREDDITGKRGNATWS